jgi:hypothetical protein
MDIAVNDQRFVRRMQNRFKTPPGPLARIDYDCWEANRSMIDAIMA